MEDREKVLMDWDALDNKDIEDVCSILKKHEIRIQDYLLDLVASLCNVDKSKVITETKDVSTIHARWFFWYAYRYMTNEPFVKIAEFTLRYGRRFTEQSISNSVNKMARMVTKETLWAKRWVIIRRIIKLRDEVPNGMVEEPIRVVVHHPKNVEVKLKIEQ